MYDGWAVHLCEALEQYVHRRTMQIVKLIDPTLPPLADDCMRWMSAGLAAGWEYVGSNRIHSNWDGADWMAGLSKSSPMGGGKYGSGRMGLDSR